MISILMSLGLASGEEPPAEHEPPEAEPDEEMIIWDVHTAREILDEELNYMGYIRVTRRKGKTIYRNRQRWKPTVILHDSGWMQLRSPVVRPRLLITPPFIGFHGTITSKRKIEAQKGRIVEQTAPLVSAWRDAIASEAAWDTSYEPPEHTVEGPDGGDIVREIIGLTTGTDPLEMAEHPLLGRMGNNGFPDPDQDMAMVRYLEVLYELTGAITPTVLDGMVATPRHDFLPQHLWDIAPEDRPITTDDGRMASPGEVAWQLSVANLQPGERVLERSGALGWRVAVMEAMGAQVSRDGTGLFDLILLEEDAGEEAAVLPMLAEGGRLLLLSPGQITVVEDGQRRTILMVH